jgi:hypothetical protein
VSSQPIGSPIATCSGSILSSVCWKAGGCSRMVGNTPLRLSTCGSNPGVGGKMTAEVGDAVITRRTLDSSESLCVQSTHWRGALCRHLLSPGSPAYWKSPSNRYVDELASRSSSSSFMTRKGLPGVGGKMTAEVGDAVITRRTLDSSGWKAGGCSRMVGNTPLRLSTCGSKPLSNRASNGFELD